MLILSDANFARPFSTNWVHIARRGDCPVCADTVIERDAEVDEEYKRIMAPLSEAVVLHQSVLESDI